MRIQYWPVIKYGKPFLDLVIVITGVTVAFLLSNWNVHNSDQAERKKVLSSLQRELKEIHDHFPAMEAYQVKMSKTWDSLHGVGLLSDFHHYYYLQPQHNYSVIEYAISTRNSEVVEFNLYEKLLILYKLIKMLEESEVYMTRIALEYRPEADEHLKASKHNLFLFDRFIGFSRNRARTLHEANQVAYQILVMINDQMAIE
jgi:hypothetical protein